MQRVALLLTLFAAVAPAARAELANPLGTVISLLDELAAKVTAEGEAEAKAYKEYVEWCDDAATNVKFEIKDAKAKKEELEATIAKTTDDSASSASKIEDLAASISA